MKQEIKAQLEQRYGKTPELAVTNKKRFGNKFINGLKGWQFPTQELLQANQSGKLLTMDIDFPGNKCALNCTYCFAKAGEQTGTYYRLGMGDKPLSVEEMKQILLQAKDLGLQSAKVIGYREPFDNPGFFDFIDFTSQNGIHLAIFTSAYTLGEKEFGGSLTKTLDFLADRKTSLMVKLHTLDKAKEDQIVGRKGYSEERDRNLRALLEDGRFTSQSPTRLGIENVLASSNTNELATMYEYFKIYRNVFIDIDPPIPIGRTGTLEEAEKAGLMPQEELKQLATQIYKINQKYGIKFEGISPYFGGPPCSQLPNGVYITLSGKVNPCCGGIGETGDIRKTPLAEIVKNNPWRTKLKDRVYHNCPFREQRGIMTQKFIKEVESSLR
jgi:MoaA/NifB/PqqE/SkfB family radical SAM enzyme